MQAIFETIFDIIYLTSVIIIGIQMIRQSRKIHQNGNDSSKNINFRQYLLFGIMAVTLGCGDAFHLVPRAIALCTTGLDSFTAVLGIGKLITSITMTVFYLLLYYVWRSRYNITGKIGFTYAVWILSLSRIALCIMPQNKWISAKPPLSWGILRNIPFALLGILIIILFFRSASSAEDRSFRYIWLAVTLSFACYIPVVLFAEAVPVIGALMIPKTCAYLWIVFIGYNAMRRERSVHS